MPVIAVTPQFQGQDPKIVRKRFPEAIRKNVLSAFKEGVTNAPTGITVSMSGNDFTEHLHFKDDATGDAHLEAIAVLPELMQSASLVESHPGKKAGDEENLKQVHRFISALRVGNKDYSVMLTVKEFKDGTTRLDTKNPVRLYHHRVEKSLSSVTSMALPIEQAGAQTTPEASEYTIRDLLSGVKDAGGQPYFEANQPPAEEPAGAAQQYGQREGLFELPGVPITRISGSEFGEGREAIQAGAMAHLNKVRKGDPIRNRDTRWALTISREDWSKIVKDPEQTLEALQAVFAIEQLAENAVLAESHRDREHNNPDVQGIHRMYAPLEINGVLYRAKLTVRDYTGVSSGERTRLHAIDTIEIEKPGDAITLTTPSETAEPGTPTGLSSSISEAQSEESAPLGTLPTQLDTPTRTTQPTTERTLSISELLAGSSRHDGTPWDTSKAGEKHDRENTPTEPETSQAQAHERRGFTETANPGAAEQVKAAAGNAGTFSESPHILQRQGPVSVSEAGGSRIGIEEARQIAKELAAAYRNAPELVVVEKPADLPFDAPDNAQGAYWRGRCFLVASNLDTAEDARMTFAHEVIGHYGLNGFFGETIHVALGDIFLHNKKVREAAQKWVEDNADYIRAVRESRKDWSHEQFAQWRRNIATEEALAQMAGRGEKITGVKKLVYAIQKLLRAIGLEQLAESLEAKTDAEALMMLHKAELFVRSGKNIHTATATDVYALFARHDRKAIYQRQVDELASGERNVASLGMPSKALLDSGIANVRLQITRDVVDKVEEKHGISLAQLKALPDLLEHPVMVFKSATDGGHVVVTSDFALSNHGERMPLVVAIRPNGEVSINYIRSVYARSNFGQTAIRWMEAGLLVSAQKKAAIDLIDLYSQRGKTSGADRMINSGRVKSLPESVPLRKQGDDFVAFSRKGDGQALPGSAPKETAVDFATQFSQRGETSAAGRADLYSQRGETSAAGRADLYSQRGETSAAGRAINSGMAGSLPESALSRKQGDDFIDFFQEDDGQAGSFWPEGENALDEDARILRQFIGEKGAAELDRAEEATVRLDNLAVAREMEKAGRQAKVIKLATGWERGADGKWRYEISDAFLRLNLPEKGEKPLGEVLIHPELFMAYPDLKGLSVVREPILSPAGAAAFLDGDTIFVDRDLLPRETASALLHEIQHAIQEREGFARGAAPDAFETDEKGLVDTGRDRRRYVKPDMAYKAVAGEVEARNAQRRAFLTPEQRMYLLAKETEDVARKDQIVLHQALFPDGLTAEETRRGEPEAYERRGFTESAQPTVEEQAQANRQYDEIVAKYKGGPLWLKAPNGEPTKLTERQWVQARTANFKEAFGDWEKAGIRERLENQEPIPVKQIYTEETARIKKSEAAKLLEENFSVKKPIGEVFVTRGGIRLSFAHSRNAAKLDVIPQLKDILEQAEYLGELEDFTGKEIRNHYFATRIAHGGQIKLVFMRVREMDGRDNQLYVHDVFIEEEIKAKAGTPSQTRANGKEAVGHLRSTSLYKAILQEIYSTVNLSISNAVDKNGEPAASWWQEREAYEKRGYTATANPSEAEQAQANRQYDEIVAKYKGGPLWLKAPNGEPTKLTERQWVQARTDNFKEEFGDWEKASQKRFLEGNVVTSVDSGQFRTTDGTKPSVKVLEYFASIGNKATNSVIGDVILDERSVRLGIAHKTALDSYAVAKDVIEKGVIIDYDNNHKGNGSEGAVIAAPVKIGNKNFIGYVVARKSGNENRFYAAGVTLRENLQQGAQETSSSADGQAAVEISGVPAAEERSRKSAIRILLNTIYAVNLSISKAVDKNGEPAASWWQERGEAGKGPFLSEALRHEQKAFTESDGPTAEEKLKQDVQDWGKRVDLVESRKRKPSAPVLMLRQTPLVMHLLGADFREVYAAPHLFDGLLPEERHGSTHNVHPNMTAEILKQLPSALADPVAVFRSATREGRFVFMLDVRDANGATVVVPVELNAQKDLTAVVHIATSAYSKESNGLPNNAWFAKQAKENALYINRQKEKRWTETSSGSNSLWVKSSASRDNKLSSEKRILTEEDLVKLKQKSPSYYQDEQQGKTRGATIINPDRTMRIELFKDADYSTFVHETAHFMLEVYRDLANAPGASAYIRKEYAAILRYLDAKPGQPITRRQHEKFARAFERYLMEGKAPSAVMRGVFSRFKDWLLEIYRYFIRLDVALSDDIRAVFDRMLATDGEIAFMRQAREMEPLFASARAMGADGAAFAAYQEKSRLEWEAAADALRARAMRQRLHEETRAYRQAYERMKQRAADAYDAQPAAKALYALTAHEGFALNAAKLRQVYGEDFLSLLPVAAGRRIYGEQGDLLLEDAAGALGFDSGDAMIRAIARLPEREAFIREDARRRMLEEEARGLRGETLAASLEGAMGNAHRLERLKAELGFLARLDKSGKALPEGAVSAQFAAMRQEAAEAVAGRQVGHLKPSLYFQAMQAAARKAREAIDRPRPNYGEAIRQKRAELMNLLLFKEASRVLLAIEDGVAQAQAVAARPFEEAVRTRDAFCVIKAKWLAARLHLGGDADALLADMQALAAGRQAGGEAFLDDAAVGPVEEMTAAAALDALGAVQASWKLARRLQVMAVDGGRVALSRAAGAVAARLRQSGRSGKVTLPAVSAEDGVMAALGGLRWHEARMAAFCRLADNLMAGESAGPLARYVFAPLKKAAEAARRAQGEALGRLEEALAGFGFVRETIAAPELGMTFGKATGYGKAELVYALLYMGSVSGLQRLAAGRCRPDMRRWAAFLSRMAAEGRLTREDYDRVQAVWDVFAGFVPRWQQAHEALFGRAFDGAAARPFVAFGRAYRGGFVPIPDMGVGGAGGQGAPLAPDLAALRSQLGEMAMFAWAAPVGRDVSRLLEQKAVQAAFGQVAPGWLDGVAKPWLACCMQPYQAFAGEGLTVLEGWAEVGRLRAGAAALLDAGAAALMRQGMGAPVFARVKPFYVAAAFQQMAKDRAKTARAVSAASSYMQSRLRADWAAFSEGLYPDGAASDAGLPALAADMFCAPVIWAAAYHQALAEEGLAHAAAVSLADGAVRQTLGADGARRGAVWQDGGAFAPVVALFQAYFAGQAQGRPNGGMAGKQAAAAALLLQMAMLPVWSGAALCRACGDAVEAKAFGRWLKDAFGWGAMDGEGLSLAGRGMAHAGKSGQPAALAPVFYPPFVGLTDAACRAMAWVGPDGAFDSGRFAQDMAAFWETACGLPDVMGRDAADDGAFSVEAGKQQIFYQRAEPEAYEKRGYTASANPSEAEQAQANRQYDEIVTKYKGSPLWLKAPNGEPTKLTERQWVQARTENFKAVFGDWEKAYIRQQLEAQVPVEVEAKFTEETVNISKNEAAKLLPEPITVETVIGEVLISRNGIRESVHHSRNAAKLDVIPYLKVILEEATYLDRLQDFTGKDIQNHYFATRIKHGGQTKLVFLRVREKVNTRQLYVHDVFIEDEIKKASSLQTSPLSQKDFAKIRGTGLYKTILQEIYSTVNLSMSNAVDKNGEPAASWWQERGV